jgi:predicted ABC-type ATPase
VLAGTNGAGKSSVAGDMFVRKGGGYLNPDLAARRIMAVNPGLSQEEANSLAWYQVKRLLERAIDEGLEFHFETTLGGKTISSLLERALSAGIEVRIWYVGLTSPELHIARVRKRVQSGGHDIPEERIRERYAASILNLIRLMPRLTELRLYDNSEEASRHGNKPQPKLVLHFAQGKIVESCELHQVPHWAKPVVLAALKTVRS